MVSVFLRLLNDFPGLLSVTTNRYHTFDLAVKIRVSLAVKYVALEHDHSRELWRRQLVEQECGEQITDDHLDTPAKHDLNGRQIVHILGVATAVAQFENGELVMSHIEVAIKASEDEAEEGKHEDQY
ncbi:hypothetical protein AYO20_08398 [Fonsecaea nubica]|uniref:Uncharacterized protein n=1 Tax=Fonsecaea nubica TaxID=856822 RepID=A0A178CNJ8_9EURO|nr:hypothetical protein AYO20_08398 [Fonsecaea nubica]OAL31067.1 hypothetical protein AYO20_08398 [Fonsecaea nubica]